MHAGGCRPGRVHVRRGAWGLHHCSRAAGMVASLAALTLAYGVSTRLSAAGRRGHAQRGKRAEQQQGMIQASGQASGGEGGRVQREWAGRGASTQCRREVCVGGGGRAAALCCALPHLLAPSLFVEQRFSKLATDDVPLLLRERHHIAPAPHLGNRMPCQPQHPPRRRARHAHHRAHQGGHAQRARLRVCVQQGATKSTRSTGGVPGSGGSQGRCRGGAALALSLTATGKNLRRVRGSTPSSASCLAVLA